MFFNRKAQCKYRPVAQPTLNAGWLPCHPLSSAYRQGPPSCLQEALGSLSHAVWHLWNSSPVAGVEGNPSKTKGH